jgi:hypothetical protein
VSHLMGRQVLVGRAIRAAFVLLACAVLPASAGAAPPTPTSSTSCAGSVSKDPAATPTSDDPNLIDYKFDCDGAISAYTLIANRRLSDFETIDDFSSDVAVIQTDGNPSATESITCEGSLPWDSINCNAGPGGLVSTGFVLEGSFDLTGPYCKNIPAGSRPGTLAEPQAMIQLVVTESSGGEDGPFRLNLTSACPVVPDRVPLPPKKAKPKRAKPKKHKKQTKQHKAVRKTSQ